MRHSSGAKRIRRAWLALCLLIGVAVWPPNADAESMAAGTPLIAVDAGHGGEDGGTAAPDGTKESCLNLQIARRMDGALCFLGCRTRMIRKGEESLADPGTGSLRKKKVSDLQNRVKAIRGSTALISIHQNSLPGHPEVHGAQVFYNRVSCAGELAAAVQYQLNRTVNAGNEKICKPAPDDIYLMKETECPAVLVECGFLSSPAETRLLTSETYQKELAVIMASAMIEFYTK